MKKQITANLGTPDDPIKVSSEELPAMLRQLAGIGLNKPETMPQAICGTCGTKETDQDNGYCINGHDNWVELRDFEHNIEHVRSACQNLGITMDDLVNRLI
jgi:hypothetical protein